MKNTLALLILLAVGASCVQRPCPPVPCPCSSPSPLASPSPASPQPSPLPSVGPSPSPTISPSASPAPLGKIRYSRQGSEKPFPGQVLAWDGEWQAKGSRGETLATIVSTQELSCIDLPTVSQPFKLRAYEMATTSTVGKVSFKGAREGDHYDPLHPVSKICPSKLYWLELDVGAVASPGPYELILGGSPVHVTVWPMSMPARPSMPVYGELTFADISAAHGLADEGNNFAERARVNREYSTMLRAHRIEPIKQAVTSTPPLTSMGLLDLDLWQEFGASFRQLVLDGAIAPPMIQRWIPNQRPSVPLLQAIQHTPLPAGSWIYLWDEQELLAGVKAEGAARAQFIRAEAPKLKIVVTWREGALAPSLVDFPAPVMDWYVAPYKAPFWLYTSCMAQGSCSAPGGTATGTPMMIVEAPSAHFRAFLPLAASLGASGALYYDFVKRIQTSWTDLWNEGGWGDGTMFYTGAGGPLPSLRLKYLMLGGYDAEYVAMAKRLGLAFSNPYQGPKAWPTDYAAQEAFRLMLGEALAKR